MASLSVLRGYRYVTPRDAARMILRTQRVCKTGPYLDCVVEWAEIKRVTLEFARLLQEPTLAEPEAFLDWYRQNHQKHVKKNEAKFIYLPL